MADTSTTEFRPPHMSFQTFWSFIEFLAEKPLPPAIDRSMMSGKSGTDQANLNAALLTFGLTDEGARVTPRLTALVDAQGESRKQLLKDLVEACYEPLLVVSRQNGTAHDLDKALTDNYEALKSSADTRRKAKTFFLHAATAAGLELSANFPTTRSGSGAPGTGKPRKAGVKRKATVKPAGDASAPEQSAPVRAAGHTQTVTLTSGGSVTLTYDVNMFDVTEEDEAFVLALIKSLRDYKSAKPASETE